MSEVQFLIIKVDKNRNTDLTNNLIDQLTADVEIERSFADDLGNRLLDICQQVEQSLYHELKVFLRKEHLMVVYSDQRISEYLLLTNPYIQYLLDTFKKQRREDAVSPFNSAGHHLKEMTEEIKGALPKPKADALVKTIDDWYFGISSLVETPLEDPQEGLNKAIAYLRKPTLTPEGLRTSLLMVRTLKENYPEHAGWLEALEALVPQFCETCVFDEFCEDENFLKYAHYPQNDVPVNGNLCSVLAYRMRKVNPEDYLSTLKRWIDDPRLMIQRQLDFSLREAMAQIKPDPNAIFF